jgi:hypothetical protein
LQSQEFVAGFLFDRRRAENLGTMLIPDFQGALTFFE